MQGLVLAMVLASVPRVQLGPAAVIESGPVAPASPVRAGAWLREHYRAHPHTVWTGRRIEVRHGGWVLLLRETVDGTPIAGARLAMRVGPDGRLRQVVGTGLSPQYSVAHARTATSRPKLWWPRESGLRPARVEESPLDWSGGIPQQERRYVDAETGQLFASESMIDEVSTVIRGWEENPLITPDLVDYDVELADGEPILLIDSMFKVFQCNFDPEADRCDPLFDPITATPDGFPANPPAIDDAEGNQAWADPYAPLQFAQFGARLQFDLQAWGWDPFVWDELDCEWQATDSPEDCRVHVFTNVIRQDEDGVFPFPGAFYRSSGQIWMGQGNNADTSYDGDIVIHEIGHHITHSFGKPEPTEIEADYSRLITDLNAMNEANSDFFAVMFGTNDRIYDYYSAIEPGVYNGPTVRDVSIPFRCPQNVVGEVHMDGRIWVSSIIDGFKALEEEGLADRDGYASAYLAALASIRHIPREQLAQLPDARAIFLDEVQLSFGDDARAIVEDVFDDRGLGACDYVLDLRDDVSFEPEQEPQDPIEDRFLVLRSHNPAAQAEAIENNPYAPPLQYRIELSASEGGLEVSYVPDLWRPPRPDYEVNLRVAALVKPGGDPVAFWRDPDTGLVENDATLRFVSQPNGERHRVVIDGLTPGATYSIALVSLSPLSSDKFVIEAMRWRALDPQPDGDVEDGGTEEGETGEAGVGDESAATGCGCAANSDSGRLALLLLPVFLRRRSRGG
jgi:hypothetical protein